MVTGSVERLRDRLHVKRRIGDGMLIERLTIGIVWDHSWFPDSHRRIKSTEDFRCLVSPHLTRRVEWIEFREYGLPQPAVDQQTTAADPGTGCAREPAPRRCGVSTVAHPVEVVARKRPTDEQQMAVVRAA